MESVHTELQDKENEIKSDSETDNESNNEESEKSDSDESSEESEDSDSYTYDEVHAILRYALKKRENK